MGAFAAWIATHLVKDRYEMRSSGIGNLAIGVLGALLGGLLTYSMLRGDPQEYHVFILCAAGAMFVSVLLMVVTRFAPRRDHARERARAHV
jgi:uncharacterized membrane protein YeaQ/YmgE (transglycosylase-associated protein family)